jgi:exopolyphosphatase/guanosine-5'-triphosphate,3'-diphosphate pyrophosphatase
MLLAVMDLGSNSFKLSVAQYKGQDERTPFRILHKERHPVQLGGSVFAKGGRISPEHRMAGLRALQKMTASVNHFPSPLVRVVGTSALREASNASSFLAEAQKRLGLRIDVISGLAEARLIAQGLEWEYPFVRKGLLVDIGGGSTEVAHFGEGWRSPFEHSFRLGSVRLGALWEEDSSPRVEQKLRTYARKQLAGKKVPRNYEFLVGSAGAIQSLGNILAPKKKNKTLAKARLDEWIAEHVAYTARQLQLKFGLAPTRARVVVPGAVILSETLEWLGARALHVTDMTLRNGLLVDSVARLRAEGWLL